MVRLELFPFNQKMILVVTWLPAKIEMIFKNQPKTHKRPTHTQNTHTHTQKKKLKQKKNPKTPPKKSPQNNYDSVNLENTIMQSIIS